MNLKVGVYYYADTWLMEDVMCYSYVPEMITDYFKYDEDLYEIYISSAASNWLRY